MQLQQRIKPGWGQLPASEAANVFIPLYARLGQLRVTLQSLSAADVAADAAGRQRLLRVDPKLAASNGSTACCQVHQGPLLVSLYRTRRQIAVRMPHN